MYIQKVLIENVRGFSKVDLDLTRPDGRLAGWTVLAGRNGSGKSTFLKAIALAVAGIEAAQKLRESYRDWIRAGQPSGRVEAVLHQHQASFLTLTANVGLTWQRTSDRDEPLLKDDESQLLFSGRGVFLVGYGPYRRLSGHASDVQRLMAGPDTIARLVSLFREDSSLLESVQWLRDTYLRRLEGRPGAAELESSLLHLLNDDLLPGNVHVEGVDSDGLWVKIQGIRLSLDELSDGYRTTAALVMDIARHLFRSFGEFRVDLTAGGEGPFYQVPYPGVVLIDEVELHLHVSWQKRIGFWLKRHFPNIQFIVTTHSPFVCQAADPGGLIRLPAPGDNWPVEHVSKELYYTVVNGSADDAVMTELFGLETPYSDESEKLRDEVAHLEARLQTGKATEEEEKELEELRSQLPQTPTGNIEQLLRKITADA